MQIIAWTKGRQAPDKNLTTSKKVLYQRIKSLKNIRSTTAPGRPLSKFLLKDLAAAADVGGFCVHCLLKYRV